MPLRRSATREVHDKRNQQKHDENEKKDFGDACRGASDASKSERAGD
jgi:hypothetical protein